MGAAVPFQPRGEVAEWRIVYGVLRQADYGDVVRYERLHAALGRDLRRNRSPLQRAVAELEERDHKTVEAVRGEGYRIVEPREHVRLVQGRARRARRQTTRGLEVAQAADRSRLTQPERERLDGLAERLARVEQAMTAIVRRQRVQAERLRQLELQVESDDTADKLAALTEKLTRRGLLDE
jgi:hypothetical protein